MTAKFRGRGRYLLARPSVISAALALVITASSPWSARSVLAQTVSTIGTTGFVAPFPGTGNAVVFDDFVFGSEPSRLIVAGETGDIPHRDIQLVSYRLPDPFGQPDGLDTGWGTNHDGRAVLDLGGDDAAFAITLDGFGRAIVVGSTHGGSNDDFFIARLTRAGVLDTTFGGGRGWVTFDFGSQDIATAVRVDSEERIVVAGLSFQSSVFNPFDQGGWDIAVVRVLDNGIGDPTFGDDGVTIEGLSDFEVPSAVLFDHHADFFDNRVWVVVSKFADDSDFSQIFILHLNADGDNDHSFGDPDQFLGHTGRVTRSFGQRWSQPSAALIDTEGRLVVAGSVSPSHPAFTDRDFNNANLAIARFKTDGLPDLSFGNQGVTVTDVAGRDDFGTSIRLDSTLKLVVAGSATTLVNHRDFVVARYDADGHLDPQFGIGGVLTSGFVVDALPAADTAGQSLTFTNVPGSDIVVVGSAQSAVSGAQFVAIRGYGEQAGAFSVTASPAVTVVAGSTASTLTVSSDNGFEGGVTVTLAGERTGGPLPAGFSAAIDGVRTLVAHVQVTPGQSTSVSVGIDVAPFVLPGTYTFWLTSDPDPLGRNTVPLTVTVRADASALARVVSALHTAGAIDNAGIANALLSKLEAAQADVRAGNSRAAVDTLAAFVNQVEAQRGKHIAAAATIDGIVFDPAAVLLADARDAITALNGADAN